MAAGRAHEHRGGSSHEASVRAGGDGNRSRTADRHTAGTSRDEALTESNGGEEQGATMNDPTPARAASADERSGGGGTVQSRSANWAFWLGVLGIGLGFLLMFAVLTPAAIVYGVRGLREIRAEPALRGRGRAWTGDRAGRRRPRALGGGVRRAPHRRRHLRPGDDERPPAGGPRAVRSRVCERSAATRPGSRPRPRRRPARRPGWARAPPRSRPRHRPRPGWAWARAG